MSDKNHKMAKNAILYSFFTLLQRGLGIFLLPIYTTVLSSNELGIISTSSAIIAFFVIIFGLSIRGSTTYFYYNHNSTENYLKKIYGTSVLTILAFSGLGILILLLCKSYLLDPLFENIDFYPYVILSLISIFFQPLYFFYQSLLKAKQLAKKAVFLDLLFFVTMIGLTVILILGFDFGAEGALIANAIASLLVFIVSCIGLKQEVILSFNVDIFKKLLKYSLPILPHNLSGWAMNMFDKVILNSLTSLSVVAFFDVGSQIGKVVNMLSLGINSAYSPWFFDQIKNNPNSKIQIANTTNKIIVFYAFSGVAVSWLAPEILKIISRPEYHDSWKIVPVISTAFVINGFYFTFSNTFFLNKTKHLPLLTLSGAVINIILNLILIPMYGFYGAAYASLFTKSIFTFITYKVSNRILPINYNLRFIILIILIGFLASSLPFITQDFFNELNKWLAIVYKMIIVSILASMFIYFNRNMIKNYLKKRV